MKIYIISFVREKFLCSQADSRIFKLNIFPEQIDEAASFFCMLIQIHKN